MSRPAHTFAPVGSLDLVELETRVLAQWADQDVFGQSLRNRHGHPEWVFYEGPPTANGKPGTHHVEARVFKDLFPRFKTMKGFHVPRRAGWDCHGLPVELEVEKKLGFKGGKQDIEDYGVAEFNQRCRESVQEHVDEFVRMTERMGYWVDLDAAYWTMKPACSSRTIGSRRTVRAAAPVCPTTRWRRATTTSPTRRCSCASR